MFSTGYRWTMNKLCCCSILDKNLRLSDSVQTNIDIAYPCLWCWSCKDGILVARVITTALFSVWGGMATITQEETLTGFKASVPKSPVCSDLVVHIMIFWKRKNTEQCYCVSLQMEPAPGADGLGLGMSLAQAKERARQKRAAKKAPAMDWSKRNELFSNL